MDNENTFLDLFQIDNLFWTRQKQYKQVQIHFGLTEGRKRHSNFETF